MNTLCDLLLAGAEREPDRRAFIFLRDGDADEEVITYSELHRKATQIAGALQRRVQPGDRAILLYPNGIEFIAAFYGCLYAGVIAAPGYPPQQGRTKATLPRLRAMVEDSGARVILTSTDLEVPEATIVEQAPELGAVMWLATDGPGLESGDFHATKLDSKAIAYLQYTSGSTGSPKGVVLRHEQVLSQVDMMIHAMALRSRSADVFWLPFYHDMGLCSSVLTGVKLLNENVLIPPMRFVQRPFRWLKAISRFRATWGGAPNFGFELCAQKVTPAERETLDLSCWECAYNGAEPIRPSTLRRFADVFAPTGFKPEALLAAYGLAESTLLLSGTKPGRPPRICRLDAAALDQRRAVLAEGDVRSIEVVSVGDAVEHTDLRIVDPDTGRECAAHEIGEVWAASPSVGSGYFKKRSPSFEARIAGSSSRSKYLRTGDLGFLMDGELFIVGRIKDVLIVEGRSLHPQDLEFTCERCHDAVRPSGVAAVQVTRGEQDGVALILLEPKASEADGVDPSAIITAVRQAVAEEHEIEPVAVVIIAEARLPKTSSGKLQRHAVRDAYLQNKYQFVAQWQKMESCGE